MNLPEHPFSVVYRGERYPSDLSLGVVSHGPPGTSLDKSNWSILLQYPHRDSDSGWGSMYSISHRQLTKQSSSTIIAIPPKSYPYALHQITWLDLNLPRNRVFTDSRSPISPHPLIKNDFPFEKCHTILAYKQILVSIPPFDVNYEPVNIAWIQSKLADAMPTPVSDSPEDKPTQDCFRQLTREWALRACLDIEKGLKMPKSDTLTKMSASDVGETPYDFLVRKLEKDARIRGNYSGSV